MNEFNIVLAGVGGQGILLAAEIVGTAAVKQGLNVRVSEIHGMAQRGGSVISTVRVGRNVSAPTILDGQSDLLLGFEQLETLRNLNYASEKTTVLMSDERIPPTELAAKNQEYPSAREIVAKIKGFTKKVIIVEATRLVERAGSGVVQNTVLIGAAASTRGFPIGKRSLTEALKELVPAKHLDLNINAFEIGYKSLEGSRKPVG